MAINKIIPYECEYVGRNIEIWEVNGYKVSRNKESWLCDCAIKYKRNPKIECKHIRIVRLMLSKNGK